MQERMAIMFKKLKDGFGLRLKELRKSRGLTQEKLAEKLDISPRQLTRIETGDNFPSPETLAKLSYILNIDLSSLFDFEWDKEYTVYTTGTDDKPVIEVSEKNGIIDLMSYRNKNNKKSGIDLPNEVKAEDSDDSMLEIAKNNNKPFTVQYNDVKGELSCLKTYYPDGKIDVLMSKDNVESAKYFKEVVEDLKQFADNKLKLEFVQSAIRGLNSLEDLDKFKMLLKGIELAMKSKV